MEYYISYSADAGTTRPTNQDHGFVEKAIARVGKLAFAVLCDGMGGLSHGEEASRLIVEAFSKWFYEYVPRLSEEDLTPSLIEKQWISVVNSVNSRIYAEGTANGYKMGSTATVMLLCGDRYYLLNIGDTRAYEITEDGISQITTDHTLIEKQISLGNMTREQAEHSPMKSVLTRCIGVTEHVQPEFFFGSARENAAYVLCTDGFRHLVTPSEIKEGLFDKTMRDIGSISARERELIELNMQRGEKDNISVVTVITSDRKR